MLRARYQVFISSTHADLAEARQRLFMTTYKCGHIPIGMEGFVASNMSQWDYIRARIDECDYFAVVVAHRYGSIMPDGSGRSFTEAEYDYAMSLGTPIIRFMIDSKAAWPSTPHDRAEGAEIDKIKSFKSRLCDDSIVDFWMDVGDLAAKYSSSLTSIIRECPRGGLYPLGMQPELYRIGISRISPVSTEYDYTPMFYSSGRLRMMHNDGFTFFDKYENALKERVARGLQTDIILIHPNSKCIPIIAAKSDKSPREQKRDLIAKASQLRAIAGTAGETSLRCYGHNYVNTYSMVMSNEYAVVNLYYTRARFKNLPMIVLDRVTEGLYDSYMEDWDRLWREITVAPENNLLEYSQ